MLTERDFQLIQLQCEQQHATTPRDFAGFAVAYAEAKQLAGFAASGNREVDIDRIQVLILRWAELIDGRNRTGFRRVPVMVGGHPTPRADDLPRLMGAWVEAFVHERFDTPAEAYKEFELIHPFIDGNGRVGHLLWALYTAWYGWPNRWPTELPPDVFSEGGYRPGGGGGVDATLKSASPGAASPDLTDMEEWRDIRHRLRELQERAGLAPDAAGAGVKLHPRVSLYGDTTLLVGDPDEDGCFTVDPTDEVACWVGGDEAECETIPGAYAWALRTTWMRP